VYSIQNLVKMSLKWKTMECWAKIYHKTWTNYKII